MKKLLLTFVLLISGASAFSQTTGGPDAFGYIWRNSNDPQGPVYNWIDITTYPGAVQVSGLGDDNTTGFIPIGFQFPYYWYTVSQFKIGSNGYIIFSNGAIAAPFPAIPSPALPHNFIAPFMSDLNFNGVGNPAQCWYWSNLIDSLIVSYVDVPFWISAAPTFADTNSFQIILTTIDSSITFQYLKQVGTSTGTGTALSIGIENISGTVGLQQQPVNTYPSPLLAVKYEYPDSSTFVVSDASVAFNDNPTSGGLFHSQNGAPFTMTAQIMNTGNQPLNPFNVDLRVLNIANATQAQQTLTSDTLAPGQTEDLAATTLFSPTTAGTYKFRTTTQLTGDATPTNNTKTLELRVVDTTQNFITLTYAGAAPVPATGGISWTGGDAGVGVEIVPPFYPAYVRSLEFFVNDDPNFVGFHSLLYDNTGPGNGPGTLLDSTSVPSPTFPDWNIVSFATPIQVDSGSLFVGWMMNGDGIVIATDTTSPISNRTYEILGGWSIYRSRETQDFLIRAVISSSPTTGIENLSPAADFGEFYPAPSNGMVFLDADVTNATKELNFTFYNLQGELVETHQINQPSTSPLQRFSFDISKLNSGAYVCKIVSGNRTYNRKLIVGK